MRKIIVVGMLFCAGCRDECYDFAVVYCQRAVACNYPVGAGSMGKAGIDACIEEGMRGVDAARMEQKTCETARINIANATCTEFRALVDLSLAR